MCPLYFFFPPTYQRYFPVFIGQAGGSGTPLAVAHLVKIDISFQSVLLRCSRCRTWIMGSRSEATHGTTSTHQIIRDTEEHTTSAPSVMVPW